MVTASFVKSNGAIREITVSGHANYTAAQRTDIVCAAISALTGSLLNGLVSVLGRNDIESTVTDGYVHIVIPDSWDELQETVTRALTDTYCVSMEEIAESYDKYLKIYYN